MPIYEYECTKCGQLTEVWQKFSDPPIKKCESCKGKVRKLISQSTFHLKGSGWYVTDYASKRDRYKEKEKSAKTEKDTATKELKDSKKEAKKDASSSTSSSKKDKD